MDFDEASKVVAPAAPELSELRQKIVAHHADHPQKQMLADHAFAELEAAAARLASLGHHITVSLGERAAGDEYPRMVYRDDVTMTVASDKDKAAALKDGWREHPDPNAGAKKEAANARAR